MNRAGSLNDARSPNSDNPVEAKMTVRRAAGAGWVCALLAGLLSPFTAQAQQRVFSEDQVRRGEYVSRLADCAACHTGLNGQKFAGGLKIETPLGTIFSTNITPDEDTGIGTYTLADFTQALRHGLRKDGATMYPAMPYTAFARMSDGDIAALYAYLMQGVAPVHHENKASTIPWPLSMRWPLRLWRAMFAPSAGAMNPAEGTESVARGAYLVEGPGHCGSCHTPRGLALQEKAYDPGGGDAYLAGGSPIDNWVAPSLRDDPTVGVGRWSEDDIVTFLKTGRIDHSAVFGGMADVVGWSTQFFSDTDLRAIARYLKSLPTVPAVPAPARSASTTAALLSTRNTGSDAGAAVYLRECAICHQNDGSGVNRMFPPMDANPVVVTPNATSVVNVIVNGGILPPTNLAPSSVAMPGFSHAPHALTDQEIADVTNFIRRNWSNQAPGTVTASDVTKLRTISEPLSDAAYAISTTGYAYQAPQPFGAGWTFSPDTHSGKDEVQ